MTREVFIGYDPVEQEMFAACVASIVKNASRPVSIIPLVKPDIVKDGLYWREEEGEDASTNFTFTRFLTPYLARTPNPLFIDCDFIVNGDINELFDLFDDKYDIMCTQHDYTPKQTKKMYGCPQKAFPRKNWSSVMLFNALTAKKLLTPEVVSTMSPAFLHQMKWTTDDKIGSIPLTWNWLEGEYEKPPELPKIIHFTNGAPCFDDYQDVDYKEVYWKYVIR